MGKTLLTPRHLLNAFFRSPSQLDVRNGGSQQKLTAHFAFSSINKSMLLVLGAVNTNKNDQGCHRVTGRFQSIRMLLSKQTGWPSFLRSHPSVKTVE